MPTQIRSLYDFFEQFPDEQSAIDHFRSIRWKRGAFCPHCNHDHIYHFSDNQTHKCGKCRKRFSIKVGTIFADTKIPLRKWMAAVWLITAHKKGIASTQLAKDIGVTQKTAWFMLHRLRHAANTKSFNAPLKGQVELDETYIGGKERNKSKKRKKGTAYTKESKAAVFGMLERGGNICAKHVERINAKAIKANLDKYVSPDAVLMTDEFPAYTKLDGDYVRYSVNHHVGEYARQYFIHINGLEGAWSLFKRQINGTHHWISHKHLQAYLDEMCYRFNRRDLPDGARINDLLAKTSGRLTYKALTHDEQEAGPV